MAERTTSSGLTDAREAAASLRESIEHWDLELRLAAAFLPEDPMNARDWARRLDLELATAAEQLSGADAEAIQPLRTETRVLLLETEAASRQFLEDSERRERAFEARERASLRAQYQPGAPVREPPKA